MEWKRHTSRVPPKEGIPLRVLIVDDSAVVRGIWRRTLSAEKDMNVVGAVENGRRALAVLDELKPDLVLLDIEMPEMDGLTALPLLLKARPGIRIIMASSLTQQSSSATVHALALGASDYIGKPSSNSLGASIETIATVLIDKIRCLKYPTRTQVKKTELQYSVPQIKRTSLMGRPQILVIGCSTGGPNALLSMLKDLAFDKIKLPIVIVQHMPAYFIQMLAIRVEKEIQRKCTVIAGGEALTSDFIGIAPGDHHTIVQKMDGQPRVSLNQNPPENFCRPAVDPLFASASEVFGAHVLGVILTGMGEDGKRGCEQIRKQGGSVIVQDEETSVVWGMPGAVAKAGLANLILPIQEIAAEVNSGFANVGKVA